MMGAKVLNEMKRVHLVKNTNEKRFQQTQMAQNNYAKVTYIIISTHKKKAELSMQTYESMKVE
jgi:hypothetical protein